MTERLLTVNPTIGLALACLFAAACSSSPTFLARPNLLAVDARGDVFVSDLHHHRVVRFDEQGRFLGEVGSRGTGRGQLWQVLGLSIDGDGTLLVLDRVPDTTGEVGHGYMVAKRFSGGREQDRHVLRGVDGAPLAFASSLLPLDGGGYAAVHGDGDRVIRYDERFVYQGRVEADDLSARSLATDGPGLWALDQYHHAWRHLDAQGRLVAKFERGGEGEDRLDFPSALDVCPGEWVAITDLGHHRVQRYALDGRWLGNAAPPPVSDDRPTQLLDVGVAPDCQGVWAVDGKGGRLLFVDLRGHVQVSTTSW